MRIRDPVQMRPKLINPLGGLGAILTVDPPAATTEWHMRREYF
jgi:hypothetical protein